MDSLMNDFKKRFILVLKIIPAIPVYFPRYDWGKMNKTAFFGESFLLKSEFIFVIKLLKHFLEFKCLY